MADPAPDPVALEDRLEALKKWLMDAQSSINYQSAMGHWSPVSPKDINLHLATLDDAIEALLASREPSLSITGGRVAAPSDGPIITDLGDGAYRVTNMKPGQAFHIRGGKLTVDD